MVGERIIEEIAYETGLDPLEIRKRNFYSDVENTTPYHQKISDNIIARIVSELEETSHYQMRRKDISRITKKSAS